uniref:Jumonji domain containing 8 n=1 Tax=Strigops habroptila TaxID=2489341 RepID=A0A672TS08_STRHB
MAAARRLLPLLLPLAWARPAACTDPPGGGWLAGAVPEEQQCTVERADASLTYSLFLQRFAFSRPVVLRGLTDNSAFRALCTREKLLAAFGSSPVRLSTANTYSYRKGERRGSGTRQAEPARGHRPDPRPCPQWTCPSRSMWSSCWSRRIRPGWAATPSTSSGTTTSPSGAPSSSNTCPPHSASRVPALPTALGSQAQALVFPSTGTALVFQR